MSERSVSTEAILSPERELREALDAADDLIQHFLRWGSGSGTMRDSVLIPRYRSAREALAAAEREVPSA